MNKQNFSSIRSKLIMNFQKLTKNHSYITEAVNFLKPIVTENHQSIYLSFNGGKDATIVLVLTFLAKFQQNNFVNFNNHVNIKLPKALYFEEPNPFPQMTQFYENMINQFQLQILTISTKKYADELMNFSKKYPLTHVIMGSRNADPYCEHLDLITDSDITKGYPLFKRVNPIIKWDYNKVWQAIKVLEIPYCKLYEQGYTSIGNMSNTIKNPTFNYENQSEFLPFNVKPETERICRVSDKK